MTDVELKELIKPAGRRAGSDSQVPVYAVTKHAGFVPSLEYFKKQVFSRDVTGYKLVEPGDFAYATIHLDEGSIGVAPERALISPMYTVFRPNQERVDPSYLIRFLKSPRAMAHYPTLGKGAVHRRKAISLAALGSLQVPLPPLDEQRRIAAILDHADNLRTKRRKVLTHLDTLPQEIFRDMFGDPLRNDRQLHTARISQVATVVTGNSPSRNDANNFGSSIEWLKSDNLGSFVASEATEKLSKIGRARARIAPPDSVLVTCIAGSPKSIGKASLIDREASFNQQINAVLPSDHLDPVFLLTQLKAAPDLVRTKSTGGMKGLVSKSAFQSIEILLPPIVDQKLFAGRLTVITAKSTHTAHLLDLHEKLFRSLQSRAFKGEL